MTLKITIVTAFLLIFVPVSWAQYAFKLPPNTNYEAGYSTVQNNQYIRIYTDHLQEETCIEFYSLKTGKLIRQLTFKSAGLVESFYLASDTNIWLFDERAGVLIETVHGRKVKEIDVFANIPLPKTGYYPYTADMKWSPLHFYKQRFYLVNSFDRTASRPIRRVLNKEFIQSVDIVTDKVDSHAPIPWLFFNRDYGMMNKFSSLRKDNILIIAPNFSNELFLFNLENGNVVFPILNKEKPHFYAAQPLLTQHNFDLSTLSESAWYAKMQQHYNNNDEYINILYDPYKNQYYRARILKDPKIKNKQEWKIIVLNDRFHMVREYTLSSDYKPNGMFVTEKGLNILNYAQYKQKSDILHFDSFTF